MTSPPPRREPALSPLVCLSREVSPLSPEEWLGQGVEGPAALWDAREARESSHAGGERSAVALRGAAIELEISGGEDALLRVAEAGRSLSALLGELGSAGHGLRAYAAVPFDSARESTVLRLPRFTYARTDSSGLLTILGKPGEPRAAVERALDEATRASDALARPVRRGPRPVLVDDGADAYRGLVARALDAIERGQLAKVVTARRVAFTGGGGDLALALLARLRPPRTTRFLVERAGTTFLGATPETLVRLSRGVAEADALAGSRAPDAGAEAALLASDKDRREHAHVVAHLSATLGAMGTLADVAPPDVLRLPNVCHLHTPLQATMPAGISVLDLVAALHPTPAVLGAPSGSARDFIRTHEGFSRGLYAGALGLFDAAGEGTFVVGIRCLSLTSGRGLLFAGGGIVAGSTVEAELRETEGKLAPLRTLLATDGYDGEPGALLQGEAGQAALR